MDEKSEVWIRDSEAQEERKRLSEALKGWWKLIRPFKAWGLYDRRRSFFGRGHRPGAPTRRTTLRILPWEVCGSTGRRSVSHRGRNRPRNDARRRVSVGHSDLNGLAAASC